MAGVELSIRPQLQPDELPIEEDRWAGRVVPFFARGDPDLALAASYGAVDATPTNIGTGTARCAFLLLTKDLVVNRVRFFGVGATTNVYRFRIYTLNPRSAVCPETAITTTANAWGSVSMTAFTILKDVRYFIACSVNATGTTAGISCLSVPDRLPPMSQGPGNMDVDTGAVDNLYAPNAGLMQFTGLTNGALPDPAPAFTAAPAAWTGGMPLFWLDNNNAA